MIKLINNELDEKNKDEKQFKENIKNEKNDAQN